MTTQTNNANGTASTTKKVFSRTTAISLPIQSEPAILWALLTNASDYPRWNSTVISIEGSIAAGQQIRLKSTLDPKRVFKLKVKSFDAEKRLVWGDAMGNREYTLTPGTGGQTLFSMTEKIGGPLFPLFAKMIPPFDKSFEQFAADLKKEAEAIQRSR
jgi:uncharacterized protein YndB with AHSA1/START domain